MTFQLLLSLESLKKNALLFFRGSTDATREANRLIVALIKDPDADILTMCPNKSTKQVTTASWDKSSVSNWQLS